MVEIHLDRAEDLGAVLGDIVGRLDRLDQWVQRVDVGTAITGDRVATDTLTAALMKQGVQPYQASVQFTQNAWNVVGWGAFVITFGDGTTANVSAGSLILANDNPYYLYWNKSFAGLQSSQTYSDVLADDRALIAMVQRPPATEPNPTSQKPFIHTFKGLGEAIHSGIISANAVVAAHIQAGSITTGKLDALAVETAKIAAGAVVADKINVAQLSAISADLGSVTAGTVTGALIRTAANVGEVGGPAGIRFNANEIAGYSGGTTKEFYLEAATGKAVAGAGSVVLDKDGIHIKGTSFMRFEAAGYKTMVVYNDGGGALVVTTVGAGTDVTKVQSYLNKLEFSGATWEITSLSVPSTGVLGVGATGLVRPGATGAGLGSAAYYWGSVYADTYYGKNTTIQAFQGHDDVALVRALRAIQGRDRRGRWQSRRVIDPRTLPAEAKSADGRFVDMPALHGLALGAVAQLGESMESLESRIAALEPGGGAP